MLKPLILGTLQVQHDNDWFCKALSYTLFILRTGI